MRMKHDFQCTMCHKLANITSLWLDVHILIGIPQQLKQSSSNPFFIFSKKIQPVGKTELTI